MKIYKIIAIVLTIALLWQDVMWAAPDLHFLRPVAAGERVTVSDLAPEGQPLLNRLGAWFKAHPISQALDRFSSFISAWQSSTARRAKLAKRKPTQRITLGDGQGLSVFALDKTLASDSDFNGEIVRVRNHIPGIKWDTKTLSDMFEAKGNKGIERYSFILVNEKADIVGVIIGYERDKIEMDAESPFKERDAQHLYIDALSIEDQPQYRFKGLATQLIGCSVTYYSANAAAKNISFDQINVVINAYQGNSRACALYGKKLGMEVIGTQNWDYAPEPSSSDYPAFTGEWVDNVYKANARWLIDKTLYRFKGQDGNLYRLLKEVGSTEMSYTYTAINEDTQTEVIVKMRVGSGEDRTVAFENEIEALQELRHPGIPAFLTRGYFNNRPLVVMEKIDGTPFIKWAVNKTPAEILSVTRQVLEILSYMHKEGYTHCDMKPAHILVTKEGRAAIIDFGLVRTPTCPDFGVGTIVGTQSYADPFLIGGDLPGPQTDLYGVGKTLSEIKNWPLDNREFNAGIADFIERLTFWNPGDYARSYEVRYKTADEAIAALDALMSKISLEIHPALEVEAELQMCV